MRHAWAADGAGTKCNAPRSDERPSEYRSAFDAMRDALQPIIDKVWRYCEGSGIRARTVTLKVKYADFEQITRSRSTSEPIGSRLDIERIGIDLLARLFPIQKGVRLLGVSLSALVTDPREESSQMHLAL